MMTQEEFKVYLDEVVARAFAEGFAYCMNGMNLCTLDEAIKKAQEKILENKSSQ